MNGFRDKKKNKRHLKKKVVFFISYTVDLNFNGFNLLTDRIYSLRPPSPPLKKPTMTSFEFYFANT